MGSVPFAGIIYAHAQNHQEVFEKIASIEKVNKKVGLSLPPVLIKGAKSDMIKLLKSKGGKKVNITKELPNYGHLKEWREWIIVQPVGDGEFSILITTSSANQGYYRKLDMNSPHRDMQRGIINLKLARSLVNICSSKVVLWDPFCGVGRVFMAAFDRQDESSESSKSLDLIASDVDSSCLEQARENIEYAAKLNSGADYTLDVFEHDVVNEKKLDKKKITVITEGWLGQNFESAPTAEDADKQLSIVTDMWRKALTNFETAGVSEIILCLPFYPQIFSSEESQIMLAQSIEAMIGKTSYKISKLVPGSDQSAILYSRPKSYVGHGIIKLVIN